MAAPRFDSRSFSSGRWRALRRPRHADRTAVVLSGGGVYGAAQAGALQAVLSAAAAQHLKIDDIIGVSAGALNAVYLAADPTAQRATELADIWRTFPKRGVFPTRPLGQLFAVLSRQEGVQSAASLHKIVSTLSPVEDISQCKVRCHVGACDLLAGETVWWTSGAVAPRLVASASIPGLLPPVRLDGRELIDGGVLSNVPIQRALDIGATRIICVDVSDAMHGAASHTGALGVLLRSFAVSRATHIAASLAAIPAATELWHLKIPAIPGIRTTDFSQAAHLIDHGQAHAEAMLHTAPLATQPRRPTTRRRQVAK